MLPELVKYPAYGLNVRLSRVLSVDQYVIQIYNKKNIQLFSQNLVNVSLEGGRSIRKAKKHDLIFEITIPSLECRLPFIAFTNPYTIIDIGKIQLGKSFCPTELIQRLANQRQWISVFDSNIIEALIIHAKAEASIWLPVEKDRCFSGGLRRSNKAVGQVGFDVSLQGFQLYWA